jgi:hypothetical protein
VNRSSGRLDGGDSCRCEIQSNIQLSERRGRTGTVRGIPESTRYKSFSELNHPTSRRAFLGALHMRKDGSFNVRAAGCSVSFGCSALVHPLRRRGYDE